MLNLKSIIIFCLLWTQISFAQHSVGAEFRRLDALNFGSKSLSYQCWDESGITWFKSDLGISNFNGYQINHYRHEPNNPNSILSDSVRRLFQISPTELWLSYENEPNVSKLNTSNEKIQHYSTEFLGEGALYENSVVRIVPDHLGNVYLLTWGKGIYKLNPDTDKFEPYSLRLETDTTKLGARVKEFIQYDGDEYLVCFFRQKAKERTLPIITNVKTGENRLLEIDSALNKLDKRLDRLMRVALPIVNCAYVDEDKGVWFGTYIGMIYFDQRNQTLQRIGSPEDREKRQNWVNVKSYVKINDELWCTTPNKGIFIVNMTRKNGEYVQSDPFNPVTLYDNRNISASIDPMGNAWFCGENGNISIYVPLVDGFKVHGWIDMDLEYSDQSQQVIPVNQMYVEKEGTVLISSNNGLQRYNPDIMMTTDRYKFSENYAHLGVKNNAVYNFKIEGDSILLICHGHPAHFDTKTKQFTYYKGLLPKSSKFLFRHSHPHQEYIFFRNQGLNDKQFVYELDVKNKTAKKIYTFEKGQGFKETFTIELNSGKWMVHDRYGRFYVFDKKNLTHELWGPSSVNYYFPDSSVRIAYKDYDRILIGTEKGLYSWDEETGAYEFLNEKIGLNPTEVVSAMVRDEDGLMWIALEKELVCWDEKNEKITRYNEEHGLNVGAFLPAIGQRSNRGDLFFATVNGMLCFDPTALEKPDFPLELSLLNIVVNRDTTTVEDKNNDLNFHWSEDEIVFSFYTNQVFELTPHKFEYRILEKGEEWISNGASNSIRFYDFPHGAYTLQVRATNGFNVTSEPYEIKFGIRTPYWLTWWFYALIVVIGASIVWYYIKYRERALKKRQEILEQTVEERTAEVVEQKQEAERQKAEAEHQKEIVEEKQQEITDSITYAKRIQDAIMPSEEMIKKYLPSSFVMYRPKDIVAGDFYWMEPLSDHEVIIAVADCTGHGVPGAMVSVVCNNALNRTVREFKITDPGKLLDNTRDLVIEQFEQAKSDTHTERDDTIKDGMDISLCYIDMKASKMLWAGANNPLWIIRNDELIEIKGNKQPIGKFDPSTDFDTHEVEIQKEDKFYIFSDGYADQFGGEKGKKFKSSSLKKLFLSVHKEPIKIQHDSIEEQFDNWKGDYEQLDDVCVIGFQVS